MLSLSNQNAHYFILYSSGRNEELQKYYSKPDVLEIKQARKHKQIIKCPRVHRMLLNINRINVAWIIQVKSV